MSGLLSPISLNATEGEVMEEILELMRNSPSDEYDLCSIRETDIQFIQVTGKVAQVPSTKPDFKWNGSSIKSLAGQGSVYVRLLRDFRKTKAILPSSDSDSDFELPMVLQRTPRSVHQQSGGEPSPSSSSSLATHQSHLAMVLQSYRRANTTSVPSRSAAEPDTQVPCSSGLMHRVGGHRERPGGRVLTAILNSGSVRAPGTRGSPIAIPSESGTSGVETNSAPIDVSCQAKRSDSDSDVSGASAAHF